MRPAIRIDGGRRINLAEQRRRRKANREGGKPVEDTRVSDAWARADAREKSAALDKQEELAAKALPPKSELVSAKVENPDFSRDHAEGKLGNYRYVEAAVNARESAIGTMMARKLLDEAQARSATRFRALWETLGGKGAGALDYSKEPVDGGRIAEPIDLRQMQAGIELKRCRELLGERGYRLVSQVCGEGYQVSELAIGKRAQLSLMDALRGFLDDLSELWGYSTRAQRRQFTVQK